MTLGLWTDYCYEFGGGLVLSLDEIEHGILRCDRPHPATGKRLLAQGRTDLDPTVLSVGQFDCRIHFALNCGARSCPAVRFYRVMRIGALLCA